MEEPGWYSLLTYDEAENLDDRFVKAPPPPSRYNFSIMDVDCFKNYYYETIEELDNHHLFVKIAELKGSVGMPIIETNSTSLGLDEEGTYTIKAPNPDSIDTDKLYKYNFDWGDNTSSGWSKDWLFENQSYSLTHSWAEKGFYEVIAKAKNPSDCESAWSSRILVYIE
jgi:hypothetical protein